MAERRSLEGLSYQEKLAFFCRSRAGAKRFHTPPADGFAERWRPSLSGILVRPSGMPPDGYVTRDEALRGARRFRQRCRDTNDPRPAAMIELKPFCGAEPAQPALHEPFSHGDWTYATDGRVVVRVPRRDDVPANPDAPNDKVAALFGGGSSEEMIPLPAFVVPVEARQECDSCYEGREHYYPSCQCVCRNCGGKRFVEVASVGIGEAIFNWRYVKLLAALPGVMVPRDPSPDSPMRLAFDGGEGLLMPMRGRADVHVPASRDPKVG